MVISCTVEPSQPFEVEEEITSSIHFRATAGEGISTRATINDSRQYIFELDDELYVTHEEGDNVVMFGFLSLVAGEGATIGTFEGELMCLNGYTPKSTDVLAGRLVGKDDVLYDRINGRLYGKGSTTDMSPVYPGNQFANNFEDAIRKFSDFRGESTYGDHSFSLEQQTAFLVFSVTFDDLISPPNSATATINVTKADESNLELSASVPVDNSMGFPLVSFIAPFAGETNLKSATFTISGIGDVFTESIDTDNNSATSFSLAKNRYYNINRTTFNDEFFTIRAGANGAHITFNFGSSHQLQYRKGSSGNFTPANTSEPIALVANEFIQVQAVADDYTTNTGLFTLDSGESCYIYGDIMSLLCDPGYVRKTTVNNSAFKNLFKGVNVDIPSGRPLKLWGSTANPVTSLGTNCYESMFQNCVSLTRPPEFPNANSIPASACLSMFQGCTSLRSAPDLPASTVGDNGYKNMFSGCTALSSAPTSIGGESGTVGASGCESMFQGCTSLTSTPVLPSLNVGNSGYKNMFNGCTYLIDSPSLPATTIGTGVYYSMFSGCSALVSAPSSLPAANLTKECYYEMFCGCSSLTSVPDLPATNTNKAESVYNRMFADCISLNLSTKTDWNLGIVKTGNKGCYQMFYGCQSLVLAPVLSALTDVGNSGCYQMFYGCKELRSVPSDALPAGTLAQQCYQSMFQECVSLVSAPDLPATTLAKQCYQSMFQGCTKLASAPDLEATTLAQQCYQSMFQGCTQLDPAPALPATELAKQCYQSMFQGCTKLASAPDIDATVLANQCCQSMFQGCTKLASAPDLLATTSTASCYKSMFEGCTTLNTPPSTLPITTIENSACNRMFFGCTNLQSAPEFSNSLSEVKEYGCSEMFSGCTKMETPPSSLPASTLGYKAYYKMFWNCQKLESIPNFPHDPDVVYSLTAGNNAENGKQDGLCYQMFYKCDALVSLEGKQLFSSITPMKLGCFNDMFSTCANLVTVPSNFLPATTLAASCYRGMFQSCKKLEQAPSLLVPTLNNEWVKCYQYMFFGCSKLNRIVCLATNPGTTFTTNFTGGGVAATGTFVINPNINPNTVTDTWPSGVDGIPSGWTVVNYVEPTP